MRFWSYALVAVVFLVLGGAAVLAYQSVAQRQKQPPVVVDSQESMAEKDVFEPSPDPEASAEVTSSVGGSPTQGTGGGKFTIVETQKIYADKLQAQTGQTVDFFTKLKNVGTEKKFLTHICFQYSGGNFGCHLNTNLGAGEEMAIHNSMIFSNPGTYTVWITWSQDKTNFYRPISADQVTVKVD